MTIEQFLALLSLFGYFGVGEGVRAPISDLNSHYYVDRLGKIRQARKDRPDFRSQYVFQSYYPGRLVRRETESEGEPCFL